MAKHLEIERKFLIGDETRLHLALGHQTGLPIEQGYLNRDKARCVRVRRYGDQGFLTIKGLTTGITRAEFEYEIPLADALALLAMCEGTPIRKRRYRLPTPEGYTWEIDRFEGPLAGLIVAEIELPSADAPLSLPDWVGPEVSGDPRYYNSVLSQASAPPTIEVP